MKTLSVNPLFQVTHTFALGSQTAPPSYNFGAMYATEKVRILILRRDHQV
jgi:mitochondrial import receptor subunit TOM40